MKKRIYSVTVCDIHNNESRYSVQATGFVRVPTKVRRVRRHKSPYRIVSVIETAVLDI
jgi:hypothetical protein